MDLIKIKSAVLNHLTNKSGLYSLKLQNHIYGCFIIMEDIAQGVVNLSNTVISTPKYSFDLDKNFSMIGVRYGFAMDTQLELGILNSKDDPLANIYHDTWIQFFKDISLTKDITEVDKIEDCLIEVVESCVKPDETFFISALDTGNLPQEWIEKVINLICKPSILSTSVIDNTTNIKDTVSKESSEEKVPLDIEKDEEIKKTALTKAIVEKPLSLHRPLSITRRAQSKTAIIPLKKTLAKTRRQVAK